MRRKTIKAKISAALSASMALAMLAPAMPAYAATGNLVFDFGTNASDSLTNSLITYKITVSGNIGGAIPDVADLGVFGGRTGLPWQNGVANNVATFKKVDDTPTNPDTPVLGKRWIADLGLKGYKIKEFRGLPGPKADFPREGLDVGSIQNQTYYAVLISDDTDAMKLEEFHKPKDGHSYVPGLDAPYKGPYYGEHHVLEEIQTVPYIIPGYRTVKDNDGIEISGTGGDKVKLKYSNDGTVGGFRAPASKFISFTTSNKPINIVYKYEIDDTKNFTVKVVDKVWNNESTTQGKYSHGPTAVPKSQNNRTVDNVIGNVLKNINGSITANKNYVDITGTAASPSRYIVAPDDPDTPNVNESVTITYDNGKSAPADVPDPLNAGKFLIKKGQFTDDGTGNTGEVLKYIMPAEDVPGSYSAIAVGAKPRYAITGQVPNQNVTITYNYYENPKYYTTVNVKYIDKEGNDITNKIVAEHPSLFTDISTLGSATPTVGTFYKDGSTVFVRTNSTKKNYDVPVPVMNDYISTGTANLPTIAVDNATDWGSSYRFTKPTWTATAPTPAQEGWSSSHQYYRISVDRDNDGTADTPTKKGDLTVTYTVDPNKVAQVAVVGIGNGQLIADRGQATEHVYGILPSDVLQLSRQNVNTATGDYELKIGANDLPTPVPEAGYTFTGWKYNNTDITLPYTVTGIPGTKNSIAVTANFAKDPNQWNSYKLVPGNSHVRILNGNTAKATNRNSAGNPRTNIPFSDIDAYTQEATGGVSVDSGYTLEWQDQAGNVLTAATNISGMVGQTFTAFAVSSTPAAVYQPTVTGTLDNKGVPAITIDPLSPAAMDVRLKYVVTDNSGNVVAVVPGSRVMANGGNITGKFLTPGNTYNIATALASAPVSEGNPIPAGVAGVSPTSQGTIPVAPTPQVTEDSANPGRASITVTPTAPNTEYALVDDNGNEVYPFTTPTNDSHGVGTVTFGNLDPGRTYHVVPRQTGSNDTPAQRQAAGADLPVSTNNLGLTVNTFDVTVIANNAALPANFKINGQAETDINKLRNLAPGTTVEILAQPLDYAFNTFNNWEIVSGLPSSSATTNARITFTMPNRPVKIQAMYSDGTSWDGNVYNDNISSGKSIGAVNPVINDTGRFRVVIDKNSVPTPIKNLIADTLTDTYSTLFLMNIKLQKFDTATNNWVDYTPAGGSINLDTTVETGALMSTREYTFHELATSSNAVSALSGDFENPSSTYPGQFDINLQSGKSYIFGYTTPVVYKVKIKDNRDNSLITNFTIRSTEVVNDKASLYSGSITGDYIDNNGITWHYEGLSTDKDTYQAYDPTLRVTSDETLYVFYSNDKAERARAERDLTSAVNDARRNLRNYDANSQGRLTAQLAAAQAILDRINRKSSTAELQAALDALNALLPTLNLRNGGGRGRGGSGGGSGSSGRKAAAGQTAGLRVGQDGNWELLNPAEATANPDSSKWVFNLTAGGRVKGWAYLSYTYEGVTKSEWYHFGDDNIMDSGWFLDGNTWYYLSMNHNGFFGEMVKGWHHDGQDGRWYYLDANNGAMHTNWSKIGGEYYFLNPTAPAQTWFYDNATGRWNFGDVNSRPLGSMYQNETTPDGYHVNESGAWRR